ncbi:MAG: ketoacyl-ACP synthase III [Deltaproteobacteria bacterium]|nr:ketoacyl-ACP synthase III [Deltaproteobacteria bacterium]
MPHSVITGTGSFIPERVIDNSYFLKNEFYTINKEKIQKTNEEIINKFHEVTCIRERRYADDSVSTSDIAYEAAEMALEGIDRESLDCIIVAHNYGNVEPGCGRADMCPSLASRVKYRLGIENPFTVAFDVPFGCPGWLHGIILADYYIKSGDAKKVLVIGAEILSRVIDWHDIDCMIYADGAGAALVEATEEECGILSHVTRSDTKDAVHMIWNGRSYDPNHEGDEIYLKMHGHDIYRYALRHVPETVKMSLDKVGMTLTDVKKVLIHQANEKMDHAILKNLFKLYGVKEIPEHIMPLTIAWLGNTSVATLPTMFDLLQRGKLNNHRLHSGDIAVFASVGAGMNINSLVYKMP